MSREAKLDRMESMQEEDEESLAIQPCAPVFLVLRAEKLGPTSGV